MASIGGGDDFSSRGSNGAALLPSDAMQQQRPAARAGMTTVTPAFLAGRSNAASPSTAAAATGAAASTRTNRVVVVASPSDQLSPSLGEAEGCIRRNVGRGGGPAMSPGNSQNNSTTTAMTTQQVTSSSNNNQNNNQPHYMLGESLDDPTTYNTNNNQRNHAYMDPNRNPLSSDMTGGGGGGGPNGTSVSSSPPGIISWVGGGGGGGGGNNSMRPAPVNTASTPTPVTNRNRRAGSFGGNSNSNIDMNSSPLSRSFMRGSRPSTGFFTQLWATLRRQFCQKRRSWVITFLEVLLPLVFAAVLVMLSFILPTTEYPAGQFMLDIAPSGFNQMRDVACTLDNSIPELASMGVQSCYAMSLPLGSRITCARPGLLTVPGLFCAANGGVVTASTLAVLEDGSQELEIPNLDDLILAKWVFKMHLPSGTDIWNDGTIMSLRTSGKIYFAPDNQETRDAVAWLQDKHVLFKYVFGGYFADRGAAERFATDRKNEGQTWMVVEIRSLAPSKLDFVIMANHSGVPDFNSGPIESYTAGKGTISYNKWYASGFLTVQKAVEDYYLNAIHNVANVRINQRTTGISQNVMGVQAYRTSQFLDFGSMLGPLVIVMAYMFPVAQLAKRLVEEKELRLREGTMIMGLRRGAFFTSWLLIYYVITTISAFGMTGLLIWNVFTHSNFLVMVITFILFGISSVNLAALLSTFFNSAKVAAIVIPLLYFMLCVPAFVLPDEERAAYHGLSVLSPIAMSVAIKLLFMYEQTTGVHWGDITNADLDLPYDYVYAIIWLAAMSVVYLLLLWYLDAVWPKQWGIREHPLFFCLPKSMGGRWGKMPDDESTSPDNAPDRVHKPKSAVISADLHNAIQTYPASTSGSTVSINTLVKQFRHGKTRMTAVNQLDLRMFPDGITVLLGHNGAGKTTVMNMMTGMMPPTSGDVRIYGKSIRHDMQAIRRDIGFCPQHNILWHDLTCLEHLQYFARLKGLASNEVEEECLEMLARVDLLEKRDVLSSNLSGGQKRKLSVAIAFMGRARLVLLDEPTAGMDVAARRHTWDVLKEMAQGRTILLTTHYMDEADLLGNRVAIMSKGCLHSYGTPMFLKNNLGSGYIMKVCCSGAILDPTPLLNEVKSVTPAAIVRESRGQECSIGLAQSDCKQFPAVIRRLEDPAVKSRFGITSISMSAATLESVFLSITNEEKFHEEALEAERMLKKSLRPGKTKAGCCGSIERTEEHHITDEERAAAFEQLDGIYSKLSARLLAEVGGLNNNRDPTFEQQQKVPIHRTKQLGAMLLKRWHYAKRDYCALMLATIAPVVCIILAMCIALVQVGNQKLHYFDNAVYGKPQSISIGNCPWNQPALDPTFSAVDVVSPTLGSLGMSNYLLDSYYAHPMNRYVSIFCDDRFGNTVLFVNATALGASPQVFNQLYTARLRESTADNALDIRVGTWPLPYTDREKMQVDSIKSLLMALCILIPFSFVPATFVAFIVRERSSKSKHLQFVSGANFVMYWLANFIFDLCTFLVTTVITIVIFFCFNREELVGTGERFVATLLLLLLFVFAGMGMAYFLSHFFTNHSTAQTMVMLFNLLTGFVLCIIMFFLSNVRETQATADILVYVFRIVPSYCLGDGLINLVKNKASEGLTDFLKIYGPLALKSTGYDLIYMAVQAVVFFFAAFIMDHPSWARRRQMLSFRSGEEAPDPEFEDDDVAAERLAAEKASRSDDVVRVQRMRKVFTMGLGKKKYAVQNLSFGVKKGEVFGFLGTNGAGKTTTMSMLTTEIVPTCGKATVGGFDVVSQSDKTRRLIGYCPQFDAIIDKLTPVEHLRLYARLRGLEHDDATLALEALIKTCGLYEYRNVPAGDLSGGNKRKLSVAMALIGGPSIVFLDEPSAGMDPSARRQLWDVISFVAKHSSVLLTTHHLEEVDVLAHRVGIMDQGLMRCVGSLEHLKHKFGNGYELIVQRGSQYEQQEAATRYLSKHFPDAMVVEVRQSRMTLSLPFNSTNLADLFQTIQQASEDPSTGIVDYTVQQTSLEQVFMRISAMKDAEHEAFQAARDSKFKGTHEDEYCDERASSRRSSPDVFPNAIGLSPSFEMRETAVAQGRMAMNAGPNSMVFSSNSPQSNVNNPTMFVSQNNNNNLMDMGSNVGLEASLFDTSLKLHQDHEARANAQRTPRFPSYAASVNGSTRTRRANFTDVGTAGDVANVVDFSAFANSVMPNNQDLPIQQSPTSVAYASSSPGSGSHSGGAGGPGSPTPSGRYVSAPNLRPGGDFYAMSVFNRQPLVESIRRHAASSQGGTSIRSSPCDSARRVERSQNFNVQTPGDFASETGNDAYAPAGDISPPTQRSQSPPPY